MQISFDSDKPRRFWLAVASVLALLLLCWLALNHLDKSLALARARVTSDAMVSARVGVVTGTTLYKLRYIDPGSQPNGCFAEYYFYVVGEKSASIQVKAEVCGTREYPTVRVMER